jgi:hypothetical protein
VKARGVERRNGEVNPFNSLDQIANATTTVAQLWVGSGATSELSGGTWGRSRGTLGALYRKVAMRPFEKCLFVVGSMAG